MFKVIITLKFHLFEVVTFEILDFEGHNNNNNNNNNSNNNNLVW